MKVTFDATAHACIRTDKQGQLYIGETGKVKYFVIKTRC